MPLGLALAAIFLSSTYLFIMTGSRLNFIRVFLYFASNCIKTALASMVVSLNPIGPPVFCLGPTGCDPGHSSLALGAYGA